MSSQAAGSVRLSDRVIDRFRGSGKPRLSGSLYRVVAIAGAAILLILFILALLPGAIAPYDPTESVGRPLSPPGEEFRLGTNDIGQDLLSELIWSARASLVTGFAVSVVAVTIGTAVGLVSGYYDNWFSTLLLRLVDLTLALPFLPLVILLSAYLGPDQANVIIILVLVSWAAPARLVRSRVLSVIDQPFVEAAHALGSGNLRIIGRHVWPATQAIVLVQVVMVTGAAILAEASLSFLGLGDPATKSWGTMLYFARANGVFLSDAWVWWVLPAGVMITLTVLGLVLVAYGLERRLEPSLRSR